MVETELAGSIGEKHNLTSDFLFQKNELITKYSDDTNIEPIFNHHKKERSSVFRFLAAKSECWSIFLYSNFQTVFFLCFRYKTSICIKKTE